MSVQKSESLRMEQWQRFALEQAAQQQVKGGNLGENHPFPREESDGNG